MKLLIVEDEEYIALKRPAMNVKLHMTGRQRLTCWKRKDTI